MTEPKIERFGRYTLDMSIPQLYLDGEPIDMPESGLELLDIMISDGGRLPSATDLLMQMGMGSALFGPAAPFGASGPDPVQVAMGKAALLVDSGDVDAAVREVLTALEQAPAGSSGWMIPIDPLLRVWEAPEKWAPVLDLLKRRAE